MKTIRMIKMRGTRGRHRSRRKTTNHDDDALLEKVWGIDSNQENVLGARLDAYLDHYHKSATLASSLEPLQDREHVVDLITLVRSRQSESVGRILEAIKTVSADWTKPAFDDEEAIQALQFVLRLWLFSTPKIDATCSWSLKSLLESVYGQTGTDPVEGVLSADFSAKTLTRKGGFYLIWTSDLAEHLTWASRDQLRIFRHAHVLSQYQRCSDGSVFPNDFLQETYRTMHLLFPFEDYKVSKRVEKITRREQVDIEAAMEEHETYQLSTYKFYGPRLAVIQQRYDEARPHRLKQWFYDRRQRQEWAALVVALVVFVLTIIFGVTQSVTGILQVIISLHPRSP